MELPSFVNFEYFPLGDFHTCFHLWEDRERELMLSDASEIHFIEMVKFRRMKDRDIKNNELQRWLRHSSAYWLDKDSPENLVEEAIKMDTAIQRAQERTAYVARDKEALRAYEMREMALSDWTSAVNHARKEGMKEGMKEAARKALAEGFSVKDAGKITGLDEDTIRAL